MLYVVLMTMAILVVEDHADSLALLARLLTRIGYAVTPVSTIAEAKTAARKTTFDLAIVDVGLPDGDGCDLMRDLRAAYGQKGLAMTGFGMPDELERYQKANFDGHIIKPFDWPTLLRLVRSMTEPVQPAPPDASPSLVTSPHELNA